MGSPHVKKYRLPPTTLIPNSPLPLIHYPGILAQHASSPDAPLRVHDLFVQNGWQTQWIFRYGNTQESHYHSATHEAMAVLSGEATIRFGVADQAETLLLSKADDYTINLNNTTSSRHNSSKYHNHNQHQHQHQHHQHQHQHQQQHQHQHHRSTNDGDDRTEQGSRPEGMSPLELRARKGDVFILPAGVAHKTYNPVPRSPGLKLLTDGNGRDAPPRESLARVELDGFTMIGAYPVGGPSWDFCVGGEHQGRYRDIWRVTRPERDPVFGDAPDGICGTWQA